ncbi:MAG: hypothetical protein JO287_26450, partial [Pseudonocardiales bacterium]|nr:hypothetical protein [Pseudonocardiales bacterium]
QTSKDCVPRHRYYTGTTYLYRAWRFYAGDFRGTTRVLEHPADWKLGLLGSDGNDDIRSHPARVRAATAQALDGAMAVMAVKQSGSAPFRLQIRHGHW